MCNKYRLLEKVISHVAGWMDLASVLLPSLKYKPIPTHTRGGRLENVHGFYATVHTDDLPYYTTTPKQCRIQKWSIARFYQICLELPLTNKALSTRWSWRKGYVILKHVKNNLVTDSTVINQLADVEIISNAGYMPTAQMNCVACIQNSGVIMKDPT